MEGERSKDTEDHFKGVIKRLGHTIETERKGCEGMSVGKPISVMFGLGNGMSSEIMEWL